MKVRFYPRDIGLWRHLFTFGDITLGADNIRSKDFHDRAELIAWLKMHGIRLDDAHFPLKFVTETLICNDARHITHAVIQWSCIGWISEL